MPSNADAPVALPPPQELLQRPIQLRGSRLARWVLRCLGWQLIFDGMPAEQGVLLVYPHTSNWDFPIGILAKWGIGIPVVLWGKDSLFRIPLFGRFLRAQGGVPVIRDSPQGAVEQMSQAMGQAKREGRFMWLTLAPEGTRAYRPGWRTGFYRISVNCQVPVGVAFLDFGNRRVGIDSFWLLGGEPALDMAAIAQRVGHIQGCRPEQAAPVRLLER